MFFSSKRYLFRIADPESILIEGLLKMVARPPLSCPSIGFIHPRTQTRTTVLSVSRFKRLLRPRNPSNSSTSYERRRMQNSRALTALRPRLSGLAHRIPGIKRRNQQTDRQTTPRALALTYNQLDPTAREKIDVYLDMLLDWNSRMNLTAIKDRPTAISRHINDSLAILPAMDNAVGMMTTMQPALPHPPRIRIVDVGSGAGLPGLVFATLRPEWSVTLLDSLNKRCTFNTAAAEAMGLGNVDILWSRAEEAGINPAYREQYDIATARAVADVRTLAELCLPLIKVGGYWVAPKGPDPEAEVRDGLRAVEELGGDEISIQRLGNKKNGENEGIEGIEGVEWIEGIEGIEENQEEGTRDGPEFTVVTVFKARSTPSSYPRKANAIKKRPL